MEPRRRRAAAAHALVPLPHSRVSPRLECHRESAAQRLHSVGQLQRRSLLGAAGGHGSRCAGCVRSSIDTTAADAVLRVAIASRDSTAADAFLTRFAHIEDYDEFLLDVAVGDPGYLAPWTFSKPKAEAMREFKLGNFPLPYGYVVDSTGKDIVKGDEPDYDDLVRMKKDKQNGKKSKES